MISLPPKEHPVPRFWRKTIWDGECLIWIGGHSYGYGAFDGGYGSRHAHRWIYEYLLGPLPNNLTLDHLCRNRACVNIAHLEPVTNEENIRRGAQVRRSDICIKCGASEWTKNGKYRRCAPCNRKRVIEWSKRHG